MLPAVLAQDTERVGRSRREAQILATLNHPNIAAIGANFAFDVTPDGQRSMAVVAGAPDPSPLTMVIRAPVR